MSDPFAVTARELIAQAEQERDLALGQVMMLGARVQFLEREVADLRSELKPKGTITEQQRDFADRVAKYVWRKALAFSQDEDSPSDAVEVMAGWLQLRLEQWEKKHE